MWKIQLFVIGNAYIIIDPDCILWNTVELMCNEIQYQAKHFVVNQIYYYQVGLIVLNLNVTQWIMIFNETN